MATQGSYRTQPLKSMDDLSQDELKSLLAGVVEAHPDLAEEVNARLDSMREMTGQRLKAASEVKLSVEQAELLNKLEADYPKMKATLERYEISTKGMPTWEQVKKGLTPEVLDKALKLAEPSLLLVPPITRQSKVEAINKNPAKGQKYDTYTYELNDNNLWNGGKSETEKKWRVSIVEGVQDIPQDDEIYDRKRTNYEMSKLWVKKYEDQGLDVMNDANAYLTLMMKGLAEDKPLDPETYTVLNGKNLTKSSGVAVGAWSSVQVVLNFGNPDGVNSVLRLRGSVGVDVPEAA